MTVEQKLKRAALTAILRQAVRIPLKDPARTARNLTDLADMLAGGLGEPTKIQLHSAIADSLRQGVSVPEIQKILESAAGL